MKRLKLLLLFITCSFFCVISVKAKVPTITCNPTNTFVGDQITCNITTEEKVEITTKLNLVAGDTILEKDGNIVYKAQAKGMYEIILQTLSSDAVYKDKVTIMVSEKTTVKPTTSISKSSNAYLTSIKVDGINVKNFSKSKTRYTIELDNDVLQPNIMVTTEDNKAKYEIDGPKELKVGENEYSIMVTAEDETTKVYKLTIIRKQKEKSSDTSLKNIEVSGYNLNFDDTSKTFYLTIDKDVSKLHIEVTPTSSAATYEIESNENLKNDSVIKIMVTAEDGTTDLYRIIIEKKENNYIPYICGFTVLFIIFLIIVIVIIKKKKNNNKKNNNKKNKEELEEKTIEVPNVNSNNLSDNKNDDNDDFEDEGYYPPIDNDEEEKTTMLSYAEEQELKRIKTSSEKINKAIDEEFEKTMIYDKENNTENKKEQ